MRPSQLISMDADALMASWSDGDERAFSVLVNRFGPEVHGFLRRHLGDEQLAEDAWSNTWIRVVRNRDRYVAQGQFRGWLYSIARGCALDVKRSRRRWMNLAVKLFTSTPSDSVPSPELRVLRDERDQQVHAALAGLSETHRAIVLLTYQQGLNSVEVGQALGMTPQQVRSRLTYARTKLGEQLAG